MSAKFNELVQSERPVVINFFATWCQPCKVMASVLNSVKRNVEEGARIVKIDIDQYQSIAAEYGVRSVPTTMIFKSGELLFRQSGVMDVNSLTAELKKYI
ncbi:thioredoxin [Elizabethkingia meningoseptica]|uniref:thioredoxin n=1 Tax=Elizabethkingia meningoseptica TaxID=238 RepID=UPI000332C01B|nr:thioredoxin [Elizabethkingia meningoseptica]AQX04248.1 thioredoxin [Elizabethkingia meningoseptica]AQX46289.1 thioredoxin [Elizabethkingia meningoseptica]EOR30807.1 Thiol-disulfide isomerase [Elizabethkingia meningoseptica ATCC 13253 = NBRC 12535]KUY18806.1 thioredoxin [Elizabethkingia meningoseptica]MDE5432734.1 thioredoxin [Elizabethkingia meningoseptica]